MDEDEKVVRSIFQLWMDKDMVGVLESFDKYFHPDIVWWNSVRGAIQGIEAAKSGIQWMINETGMAKSIVTIRNLAVRDHVVFVERTEDLRRADGSQIALVPVTGILVISDGKVAEWRDYCGDWMSSALSTPRG